MNDPMDRPYLKPQPPASPPQSSLAITSLVAGILSWLVLPVIASLVAIVTGHMAHAEIRRSDGRLGGKGMATTGLILGYLSMFLAIAAILFFVVAALFLVGVASQIDIQTEMATQQQVESSLEVLPEDASVELKVRTILAALIDRPVDSIETATTLESLGLDELDRVEFVMELEDRFPVEIDQDEEAKLRTVGDYVGFIEKSLAEKPDTSRVPEGAGTPATVP